MHRTLSAITLAAFLLSPSSLLDRLWDLVSGQAPAHVSAGQAEAGPGLDPNGVKATVPHSKAGPGWDPDGLTATPPTTEAGPGLDPFGHS